MPAVPLVEQGGVLDVAASHVRSLRQAADELHLAGIQLQMARVPLYNIPDAVDVLATGKLHRMTCRVHDEAPGAPPVQPRVDSMVCHYHCGSALLQQ